MQRKPRILFLRSNPIAPDPRVEKEARTLVRGGYSVNILCWDREGKFPGEESTDDSYTINRIKIIANYGTGLSNLPALIRWQFALLFQLIKCRKNYEILHACDFDTVLPAMFMKLFYGKKVIYDIFDFYADHLRRTPGWIKSIIKAIDLRIVNDADGVILVDENRKTQIAGSKPSNLTYIYNTPADIYNPLQGKDENPKESLSITYVGLLQWERGLLSLINAVKKNPNYHLDIAGFGGDQTAVEETACNHPNIEYYGRVQYDQALELSQKADLIWALYDPSIANHQYASPNKLFEAMMLGKPVIVARNTNIDTVVENTDCGYIVDYQDEQDIEAALNECASDIAGRVDKGHNARRSYERQFSWAIMGERLLGLYAVVIQKSKKNYSDE